MTEKENDRFLIEIEKSDSVTTIRVSGFEKNKFDNAYRLTKHFIHRAKELDIEIEEERKLDSMKSQTTHFWTKEGSTWILDESTSNPAYRIALSLLRTHPACKQQVEVKNETGVAKATISENLGGKVESTSEYFYKCEKGHRLSEVGLQWMHDEVIPSILNPRDESQQ